MRLKLFIKAFKGKRVWKKLKNKYGFEQEEYLLVFRNESDLNMCVLKNLNNFLSRKYVEKAYILSDDPKYISYSCRTTEVIILAKKEVESLVYLDRLMHVYARLVVISLHPPFGSYGLLNKNSISLDEMVNDYLLV